VPIVVTKNGYGEMVMMSIDLYNETVAKLQAAVMLQHSVDEVASGAQPEKAADYFNKAREKYGKQI
jgi:PHD/YefM family antitoxin component YafN of YafNO toxin-antitoxin module